MDSHLIFEQPNFALQSGEMLPKVRLAYRTWGTLSQKKDNVILFPTWFSSTHKSNEWLIGPGMALDPTRYYIVAINLLGNGLSSSPSNTTAPFNGRRFPRISMLDNVKLQVQLLRTLWKLDGVELVIGRSMGAQFAFQLGCYYPDFAKRLFCLCGSARTTPHNFAFLEGLRASIKADCIWAGGEYSTPPTLGLRAVGIQYAAWALSPEFYRLGLHRTEPGDTICDYLEKNWAGNFLDRDANNLMSMIDTWQMFDPSDNERFHGNWRKAMQEIKSRTVIMPSRTDMYFPPEDSALAADAIPHAQLQILDSAWGHRAGAPNSDPKDIQVVDHSIRSLLQDG